ncbi:hypothetical protein JTB14_017405, partial [Gonioctena quinquepunctata]
EQDSGTTATIEDRKQGLENRRFAAAANGNSYLPNILKALRNATQGRTSICIAHRLSTIMDADEIIVLEDGLVANRGTHQSLLQDQCGLYFRLWDTQNHSQFEHSEDGASQHQKL